MRFWNSVFALITTVIVVTMLLPSVFGMQSYTQWGGMYTDGWCSAYIHAVPKNESGNVYSEELEESIQCPTTTIAWSAPMHNFDTCMQWAMSWCNKIYKNKWKVISVQPYYRSEYPYDSMNLCNNVSPHPSWFIQNY